MKFIIEDDRIGLVQYTHADDRDMYECWQDEVTQRGYNGAYYDTFEQYAATDIARFRFWVTAVDKANGERVGSLRLGLDDEWPDLAIWIYPGYRHMGYGRAAYALALEYLFERAGLKQVSAGCYEDNEFSRRILQALGFERYPAGDEVEPNYLTGAPTVQQEYRLHRADFNA